MNRHLVRKTQSFSFVTLLTTMNFVLAASPQMQGAIQPYAKQFAAHFSVDAGTHVNPHQNRANRNTTKRRASRMDLTQPVFQTAVGYASGGQFATAVAVADLNADGKPDL